MPPLWASLAGRAPEWLALLFGLARLAVIAAAVLFPGPAPPLDELTPEEWEELERRSW